MRKTQSNHLAKHFEYDVCLSFAGEDRAYVRQVADRLRAKGVRVFFDQYAQADMWGRDLYTHLDGIYQDAARYYVLFASKHYAKRVWPNHERESAQARAVREHTEYILPARFDNTRIPGLRHTVGYIDLSNLPPAAVTTLIVKKLGDRPRENYFPPIPDQLFVQSKAKSERARDLIETRARHFFAALTRTSDEERKLVMHLFLHTCIAELPENVHASIDLLRRVTGFSENEIVRLLGNLRSLGFYSHIREDEHDEYLGATKTGVLKWHDMSAADHGGNATGTARDVILTASLGPLIRLDFSDLATATKQKHPHAVRGFP